MVDGIKTPKIEKILVDIASGVEFSFLRGVEINYVYNTIFEKHNVNKNKLLRYASRRGRKQLVEELLKTIKESTLKEGGLKIAPIRAMSLVKGKKVNNH